MYGPKLTRKSKLLVFDTQSLCLNCLIISQWQWAIVSIPQIPKQRLEPFWCHILRLLLADQLAVEDYGRDGCDTCVWSLAFSQEGVRPIAVQFVCCYGCVSVHLSGDLFCSHLYLLYEPALQVAYPNHAIYNNSSVRCSTKSLFATGYNIEQWLLLQQ